MKEKVLFSILVTCFLYINVRLESVPKSTIESFIINYLEDKQIVPVRIELNAEQQTEHVSSIGGETLYDFNQGHIAYKDFNSSQCFVTEVVGETLERDRRKLLNLQKGIVRSFYLPTFIIQEKFTNETNLLEKFGIRITEFCNGSTVSFVGREQRTNRRKRDAPEEKGQFTHHSYGHYGHQSNNYAHYGHETHITGSVDKDGNVRNHQVSQHQVKSEGSKSFPDQSSNVPQVYTTHSRTGFNPQFQTQPSSQQTWSGSRRPYSTDTSGQFSLQTAQESGYQLNLPLGLKAGNSYRGGIRSSGQYSVGGPQPQITDYQKYPTASSEIYQPSAGQNGLRQISPHSPLIPTGSYIPSNLRQSGLSTAERTKISDRGAGSTIGVPGYYDQTRPTHSLPSMPETKMQGQHIQPGISIPVQRGGVDHRLQAPGGVLYPQISDSQTDSRTFIASEERPLGAGYQPSDNRLVDRKVDPTSQVIPYRDDQQRIQGVSLHQPLPGRISPDAQRTTQGLEQPVVQTTALRPPIDQRIYTGGQVIPSRGYQPGTFYPGSGVLAPNYQTSFQPDAKIQSPYLTTMPGHLSFPGQLQPTTAIPGQSSRQIGLPGQATTGIGGQVFQTTGIQNTSRITEPGYHIVSPYPDSRYQQYAPGGPVSPHYLQLPGDRYPIAPNGIAAGSQTSSSPSSSTIVDRDYGRSLPGSASIIPGSNGYNGPGTISRYGESARHYPQYPSAESDHLRGTIPSGHISPQGVPISTSRDTAVTGMRPDDLRLLQPRGTDTILSENFRSHQVPQVPGTFRQVDTDQGSSLYPPRVTSTRVSPESTIPRDRTVLTGQSVPGISRLHGQESASSQTQIQTNNDGTAAEASAAGQYRGLGSQTQVQGGYAGNGSFSAQAQSGFTGGVVQSQIQGNSQGGLSGSSAQVEQLGEAQSQVQVGQPSGSASSSAQGRFTGGITQVQAQSGKTGGSAGAQSQSSGLSSSHVQVNIGGKDVSEKDHFQGSVSASVHGGYSSGQSQTQLQGGYHSGRTYVATAQGGFDSSLGFQGSVPQIGSLPRLSGQALQPGQYPGITSGQRTQTVTSGGQLPISSSPGMVPPGSGITDRTPDTFRTANQTANIPRRSQPPSYEHPVNTFVDQRQPEPISRYPPHLTSTGTIPQQGFMPSAHHAQTDEAIPSISYLPGTYQVLQGADSTTQYPVLSPGSQQTRYLTPSSQFTARHPYSTHQTDLTGSPISPVDNKLTHESSALPSYKNGQTTGQRKNGNGIDQPSAFLPGTIIPDYQPGLHVSPSHFPGIRQQGSPGTLPASQQPIDRVPTGQSAYFQPSSGSRSDSEDLPHLRSQHTPGYPSSHIPILPTDQMTRLARPDYVQQPGFQQGFYYPPQIIPGQPQISPPRPEIFPSQHKPSELPILTKPDGSYYIESQPRIPQQPGFYYPSQQIPGQPQISPPQPDALPSLQKPRESPIVIKPDDSHYIDSRPSAPQQPGYPQISPSLQQVPHAPGTISTSRTYPPLPTTDRTRTESPGVQEPDTQNCCEALRNLKRRCCGRTDRKQDGNDKSSCCKSKTSDFDFDFSSEDDLDDTKGNGDCKVVKAICYIVYKPVGKARVCKPTQTNGC